jgi:hypothetical protein
LGLCLKEIAAQRVRVLRRVALDLMVRSTTLLWHILQALSISITNLIMSAMLLLLVVAVLCTLSHSFNGALRPSSRFLVARSLSMEYIPDGITKDQWAAMKKKVGHTNAHIHTRTHTHAHIRTLTLTHAHTHVHTHAHANTHTHTHTHRRLTQ